MTENDSSQKNLNFNKQNYKLRVSIPKVKVENIDNPNQELNKEANNDE